MKLTKTKILLIVILTAGFLLRFIDLGKVPVSLTDDEIRIAESAYSIGKTLRDPHGKFLPLSVNLEGFAQNPVPVYLTAPFVTLLKPSPLAARLPAAIMGTLNILLVYLLATQILGSMGAGLAAAGVMAINVWAIQVSRFSHEGAFALFFYLLGLVILLTKSVRPKVVILGCLSLILAFYSYHATKVVLPLIIISLLIYRFKDTGIKYKSALIATVILAFGTLFILSKSQSAIEYGNGGFFFSDKRSAAQEVELERRISSAPQIIKTIYINKYAYWARIFVRHYFYAFSGQYLFTDQEANGIYAMWNRGQFYLVEIPFLIFGCLTLFAKKKKAFLFLTSLVLIAPLPSAVGVGDPSYTMRSILLLPILSIFIGSGILAVYQLIRNKKFRKLFILLIGIIYLVHLTAYLLSYYYDWRVNGARFYSYATRQMTGIAQNEAGSCRKVYVAPGNFNTLMHFAFYTDTDPRVLQMAYRENNLSAGNVTILPGCLTATGISQLITGNSELLMSADCNPDMTPAKSFTDLSGQPSWNLYTPDK